jgi:thiol-disulfide isomerase/thioredoxin
MKKPASFFLVLFIGFFLLKGVDADAGGAKAPPFELNTLLGKKFTQDQLSGKVTLMIFWASWCGTCQKELPKVHDLQEKMKGRPFQAVAIGFKDSEANIREYVRSHPKLFSFPVLYDAGDQVANRFGANFTPTLFLLDKNGELVIPFTGPGLLENPRFHAELERLL